MTHSSYSRKIRPPLAGFTLVEILIVVVILAILAAIVVAVFAIGLYPEPLLRKTELAARQYQSFLLGTNAEVRP